jgi:hypothetical protein
MIYAIGDLCWWRTTSGNLKGEKRKAKGEKQMGFANREMKREKGPTANPHFN